MIIHIAFLLIIMANIPFIMDGYKSNIFAAGWISGIWLCVIATEIAERGGL
jgi:hypothetical protein